MLSIAVSKVCSVTAQKRERESKNIAHDSLNKYNKLRRPSIRFLAIGQISVRKTAHAFRRGGMTSPNALLSCSDKPAIIVRYMFSVNKLLRSEGLVFSALTVVPTLCCFLCALALPRYSVSGRGLTPLRLILLVSALSPKGFWPP